MAKGALYWRLKDEKTGKWSYKKVTKPDLELIQKMELSAPNYLDSGWQGFQGEE